MPCYVLRCGDTEMVKIGWADEDVEGRRLILQSAHWQDLTLLRVLEGGPWIERAMHERFAEHRVRREWFQFHADMLTIQVSDLAPPKRNPGGTVGKIIDAIGGPLHVATSINVPPTTVNNWKGRNSIPARYHASLIRISNGKITAEQLTAAHAMPVQAPAP